MSIRFVLKLSYKGECVRVRPEPQFCNRYGHILDYIRETWPELSSTGTERSFGVYYYDEAGDQCTLNERTFPDCLMLLQERNAYKDSEELPVLKLTIKPLPEVETSPRPVPVMVEASRRLEEKIQTKTHLGCPKRTSGKLAVHRGFICDGCEMDPLVGDRYKCNYCDDFDYCSKCYERRLILGHNPFHAFTCYKMPRPPTKALKLLSTSSDKDTMTLPSKLEEKSVGDAPVAPKTKSVGTLPEPSLTRDESVQWESERHCTVAGPWGSLDIFSDEPIQGSSQNLAARVAKACTAASEAMGRPAREDLETADSFAVAAGIHLGIQCDLCGELPIVGPRFKCRKCKDYDLCQKCFDLENPSKAIHDHPKSSFRTLTPLDTILLRKDPHRWEAPEAVKEAPVVDTEACGGPMFGSLALVSPEPEPAALTEATSTIASPLMEPENGGEIEMEDPPAGSTHDDDSSGGGTESDSIPESWMDLGELEDSDIEDVMIIGTPRSDDFQVITSIEEAVEQAPDSLVTAEGLAEALVHHGIIEDRNRAAALLSQVSSNEELRSMLCSFLGTD
ncbi:hypothetical protein FOL47_010739 [Perkinsus chesapeaki]|uniref:ZZ-type domain-containing protein n=1 Tax=Perkinsus chesapeaki TaxID=330153 RepID=A0A7J6MNX7_PERCH|nr:hypothetical protein FOL47_010739 [Perkinsus chesapeaki]